MTSDLLVTAAVRNDIADFISALITVYVILIFAHILLQMVLSFGGRIPYSTWSSAIMGFLRDVTEPYLAIFRRFVPRIGMFDLSPMVAILALYIVGGIVVGIVDG